MLLAPSPVIPWDPLEAWLRTLTHTILPKSTTDLQLLSKEELDARIYQLMVNNNPAECRDGKELAKLTGNLAYILLAQARLIKKDFIQLEHQAKEAQDAREAMREKNAKLQEQVDKLQSPQMKQSMENGDREQREKEAKDDPTVRLQEAETPLQTAEPKLSDKKLGLKYLNRSA